MTNRNSSKLSPAQKRAIDDADGNRITCAPTTAAALRAKGIVGPVVLRFALPEQSDHGTWFNRQFVRADLVARFPLKSTTEQISAAALRGQLLAVTNRLDAHRATMAAMRAGERPGRCPLSEREASKLARQSDDLRTAIIHAEAAEETSR